jgi:hypothetical protein
MPQTGRSGRGLGEDWDRNRLSFAEMTIGTGHFVALMRALRVEEPLQRVLFAALPGEGHDIGITIAADLLRDAGRQIDPLVALGHDGLIAHVERSRPSIIGRSLSTEGRLGARVRPVVALRIVTPHVLIGVALAAALDAGKIGGLADLDLILRDAPGPLRGTRQALPAPRLNSGRYPGADALARFRCGGRCGLVGARGRDQGAFGPDAPVAGASILWRSSMT